MKKRILILIKYLLLTGLVGFLLIQFLLPTPAANGFGYFILYGLEYILVVSGPIATLLLLTSYLSMYQILPLLIGGILSAGYSVFLIIKEEIDV